MSIYVNLSSIINLRSIHIGEYHVEVRGVQYLVLGSIMIRYDIPQGVDLGVKKTCSISMAFIYLMYSIYVHVLIYVTVFYIYIYIYIYIYA